MSLPPASPRRHLHTRTISMQGYERDDGLFDIEARVTDTKTSEVLHPHRQRVAAGDPWHDMLLRMTVDEQYNVRDLHVSTEIAPYPECSTVAPAYKAIIGANLGKGFRKAVNDAVGGVKGCTHLKELLMPAATTAFQTIAGRKVDFSSQDLYKKDPDQPLPFFMNSCKSWAVHSEQVLRFFPQFYKKKEEA